jgi:lactoylglutathione lyase
MPQKDPGKRQANTTAGDLVMQISHIALYTDDLEGLRAFYEKYFYAIPNQKYKNETSGLQSYFLHFNDGARLELITKPRLALRAYGSNRIGFAHLAFGAGSRKMVDSITAMLVKDGYPILCPPRVTGDGYYESRVSDPDGNEIEITE